MVGVCSSHVRKGFSYVRTVMCTYIFHSFLALNSMHIISEASNLTTTFVLMLVIMLLSFMDWRHGLGVFLTCEEGIFT